MSAHAYNTCDNTYTRIRILRIGTRNAIRAGKHHMITTGKHWPYMSSSSSSSYFTRNKSSNGGNLRVVSHLTCTRQGADIDMATQRKKRHGNKRAQQKPRAVWRDTNSYMLLCGLLGAQINATAAHYVPSLLACDSRARRVHVSSALPARQLQNRSASQGA